MNVWTETDRLAVAPTSSDHTQGPDNAGVVVVEYADYQCPYCGQADGAIKEVQADSPIPFRYVFRNFPLVESHPYALQAAEAAAMQGKFWEMHDILFQNQRALDEQSLVSYAQTLGLDVERFVADQQSDAVTARIQGDLMSGQESGVEGTPTFYVNGVRYEGNWDPDSLAQAVNQAENG